MYLFVRFKVLANSPSCIKKNMHLNNKLCTVSMYSFPENNVASKNDGWKIQLPFGMVTFQRFHGHVSFRSGGLFVEMPICDISRYIQLLALGKKSLQLSHTTHV